MGHCSAVGITFGLLFERPAKAAEEGGKEDPKLCLLRFEPDQPKIRDDASRIVDGIKLFLGMGDPKEDYEDSVARGNLK
ncbi:hypothetical protein [Bradyrhizobium sp.]|uniref:hypothetical protein n=1 Tax=Bradyrhizobium sp. TaxID=376 RepID=UPI0039E470C9